MSTRLIRPTACIVGLLLTAGLAHSQTLTGATFDTKASPTVTATVNFESPNAPNCGIYIHWGDGQSTQHKITDAASIPLITSHTYAKPGSYAVMVEPKRVTSHIKCVGKNINANVTVAGAAPAPVAAPSAPATTTAVPAAAGSSTCPAGWKMGKVDKKTKAFTCSAKAGTSLPMERLNCPGNLSYFENAKKAQLGCKP